MGAILMLAKSGHQVATIVGTSKDFLTSQCFGELATDAWPTFFYHLQFKNARPAPQAQAAIQQRLAGTWSAATSLVGLQYIFQANGRYASTGATRHYSPATSTETTQAYFGDGAYSFDGNTIVFTNNDHSRTMQFFRLEQVSKNSGQSWDEELCLLEPGSTGEVCYRKQ